MNDPQFERPWWTRRGFLQGTAAVAAGIYGLPARLGHAPLCSYHQVSQAGSNP